VVHDPIDGPRDSLLVLVARLEGKFDSFVAGTNVKLENLSREISDSNKVTENLDRRISRLESWRNYSLGVFAVLSTLGLIALTFILSHGTIELHV
jgi:hypothetical protein